jgi:hypothetical protein
VEPRRDERVGGIVQRVNPTVLAAIALGALILLIVAMMLFAGRNGEDDRLGNEVIASREDPEQRCSSRATYDQIKRELFRRAAALRGSDQAVFGNIAGYSTVRMEAPALSDENAETDAVSCNGSLTLDLPPGVAVVGGRRSLSADVLYTIQPAADGSGSVVTLANADDIITPLATLARTQPPAEETLNQVAPVTEAPAVEPAAPADPLSPTSDAPAATANPSFNCANARTSGEVAARTFSGRATPSLDIGTAAPTTPVSRRPTAAACARSATSCSGLGVRGVSHARSILAAREDFRLLWPPRHDMRHTSALLLMGLALAGGPAMAQAPAALGCKSPEHRQFDFWVGTWDVSPTGQNKVVARSVIENLYGGCVIRENWMPAAGTPGGSLNTFDPADNRWHQVWMDASNARVSFDGDLVDGSMVLTGNWRGAQKPGQDALVRMTYSRLDGGAVRQKGEISTDRGTTWKPYFDFTYRPVALPK